MEMVMKARTRLSVIIKVLCKGIQWYTVMGILYVNGIANNNNNGKTVNHVTTIK